MDIKKGKILVIVLFLIDILISIGVISYKSNHFKTDFNSDIFRLLVDLTIIACAYYGIRWMKGIYMALSMFNGIICIFLSIGILISESFKLFGLMLLGAGIFYVFLFFLFVYSKLINDFLDDQRIKFKMKYNNHEMR